jgi:multidrug resistance efflux pump
MTITSRTTQAAAGAAVLVVAMTLFVRSDAPADGRDVLVRRAAFVESIVEGGTVHAARVMVYGAPLGAVASRIVELAPEGSIVGPGDVLVRLDTAPLEAMLAREAGALMRARADLRAAEEELTIAAGTERVQVMEAEAALAEATREVARARTAAEDLRPMLAEGFITRAELERAEQALTRAIEQRALAGARLELRTTARAGGAAPARRSPRLDAAAAQVTELEARVDTLRRQIEASTVRAERPGLLVYRDLFFGSERRKPQLGDEAVPNQPLVSVPDASTLTVETRVREIDVHRVADSQRVQIRVDAYPDLRLTGRITLIGALAQEDLAAAGTRFFPVTVGLDHADARLRTGMTAQVEIEAATIPSAIVVPLEAVLTDDEGTHCLVPTDDGIARRAVVVWARNDTDAAIKSGLSAGERVRLPGRTP